MKILQIVFGVLLLVVIVSFFWLYGPKGKVSGLSTTTAGVYEIEIPDKVSSTDPFTVKLNVDTKGKNINAVGLHLKYATNRLQILKMDTTQSFCEFYPENRYDNQKGEIKISCGLPSPGFNGIGTLAIISFEPLSVGATNLEIVDDSAILLNDGKATNILKEFPVEEILVLGNL